MERRNTRGERSVGGVTDLIESGCQNHAINRLSLLEAILLALVEEIRLGAAEIDDLRASIAILLLLRALLAVVGIRDTSTTADDAAALEGAVVALVADANQGAGPHVRVADHALAVAFLAEPTDGDAGLLAAHDEIRVMLRHILLPSSSSCFLLSFSFGYSFSMVVFPDHSYCF